MLNCRVAVALQTLSVLCMCKQQPGNIVKANCQWHIVWCFMLRLHAISLAALLVPRAPVLNKVRVMLCLYKSLVSRPSTVTPAGRPWPGKVSIRLFAPA